MINYLDIISSFKFELRHVVEVGVNEFDSSQCKPLFETGLANRITLVEPQPDVYERLAAKTKNIPNVRVLNWAIVESEGIAALFKHGPSTFLEQLKNVPTEINDGYKRKQSDKFLVEGHTIEEIDDGKIDLLIADTEGAEFYCLKYLISRPMLIILETHRIGHPYLNPYLDQINQWMNSNKYLPIASDATDTAYTRGTRSATRGRVGRRDPQASA